MKKKIILTLIVSLLTLSTIFIGRKMFSIISNELNTPYSKHIANGTVIIDKKYLLKVCINNIFPFDQKLNNEYEFILSEFNSLCESGKFKSLEIKETDSKEMIYFLESIEYTTFD